MSGERQRAAAALLKNIFASARACASWKRARLLKRARARSLEDRCGKRGSIKDIRARAYQDRAMLKTFARESARARDMRARIDTQSQ